MSGVHDQNTDKIPDAPEILLARSIHRAFGMSSFGSYIEGEPEDDWVSIDGKFNLIAIAKAIIFDFSSREVTEASIKKFSA
jgi:hypothetical protein